MSRAFKNRKNRPDSVRIPAVPNLSKHPIMLARSSSTGPPCSGMSASKPITLHKSSSITAPTTPASKKKTLDKIPSISAQSESSEEDEEEDEEPNGVGNDKHKNHFFNNNVTTATTKTTTTTHVNNSTGENHAVANADADDDDEDDDDEILHKRVSVIAHEFPNNINWSPTGDSIGELGGCTSANAKNISTKMACGLRMCRATGRNFIKMLSTSNGHSSSSSGGGGSGSGNISSSSGGKFGSQTKPLATVAAANNENSHHISRKVKFNYFGFAFLIFVCVYVYFYLSWPFLFLTFPNILWNILGKGLDFINSNMFNDIYVYELLVKVLKIDKDILMGIMNMGI